MTQKMVTSNVRMPVADWLEVKAVAGEMGMSINEYINFSTQTVNTARQLFSSRKRGKNKYAVIWDIIKQKTSGEPMGWSEEDEAIYSV